MPQRQQPPDLMQFIKSTNPQQAKQRVEQIPGVKEATVNVVFDPPWTSDRLSETARLELGLL